MPLPQPDVSRQGQVCFTEQKAAGLHPAPLFTQDVPSEQESAAACSSPSLPYLAITGSDSTLKARGEIIRAVIKVIMSFLLPLVLKL